MTTGMCSPDGRLLTQLNAFLSKAIQKSGCGRHHHSFHFLVEGVGLEPTLAVPQTAVLTGYTSPPVPKVGFEPT